MIKKGLETRGSNRIKTSWREMDLKERREVKRREERKMVEKMSKERKHVERGKGQERRK